MIKNQSEGQYAKNVITSLSGMMKKSTTKSCFKYYGFHSCVINSAAATGSAVVLAPSNGRSHRAVAEAAHLSI
eukprot:IDg15663t1